MWTISAKIAARLVETGCSETKSGDYDINKIIDKYGYSTWHMTAYAAGKHIAENRWRVDFDTDEKTWERIGCPRYDETADEYRPSYNFRDNRNELGLSVIDDEWTTRINYAWWQDSIAQRGMWVIKGVQCGWGSDGEPVIIPTGSATKK